MNPRLLLDNPRLSVRKWTGEDVSTVVDSNDRDFGNSGQFSLNDEQRAIRNLALSFAADRIAPDAIRWDHEKYFPRDVICSAAPLGFGGVSVAEDVGGSALSRLEGVLIYDSLATACPCISGYFSVHNMVALVIDRAGTQEQRQRCQPRVTVREEDGTGLLGALVKGAADTGTATDNVVRLATISRASMLRPSGSVPVSCR